VKPDKPTYEPRRPAESWRVYRRERRADQTPGELLTPRGFQFASSPERAAQLAADGAAGEYLVMDLDYREIHQFAVTYEPRVVKI